MRFPASSVLKLRPMCQAVNLISCLNSNSCVKAKAQSHFPSPALITAERRALPSRFNVELFVVIFGKIDNSLANESDMTCLIFLVMHNFIS